jgi:hypothetical protein
MGAGGSKNKLVEMTPFGDAGSGSDDGIPKEPPTMAEKAKGWLAFAAKPLTALQESREKAAAQAERLSSLQAGAAMRLIPDARSEQPKDVRVALSSDGSMVTWSGQGVSGVMALSAVRDVKEVQQQGFFRGGGPVPGQWSLVADDQVVRFEASSDDEKVNWMTAIAQCRDEQLERKTGRKLAYQAKRRMGMEERKREAERRKAEILKTCTGGGMRHTAQAMINRA